MLCIEMNLQRSGLSSEIQFVIAGLVPATHDLPAERSVWVAGTGPAMTFEWMGF
jgi:hypothetical protein